MGRNAFFLSFNNVGVSNGEVGCDLSSLYTFF